MCSCWTQKIKRASAYECVTQIVWSLSAFFFQELQFSKSGCIGFQMLPLTDATAARQPRTLTVWRKASVTHCSLQRSFPQMTEFMFVSVHSKRKPLGAAQLICCVVLANGLAESCPATFEPLINTEGLNSGDTNV